MEYDQTRMQLHIYNAIYKETDAVYSGFAKRSGLSDCAFWLLYSIRDSEDTCRQKDLCGQWTMSKQTVNSALKGLEKQGFIVLEPDVDDGKSKRIRAEENRNPGKTCRKSGRTTSGSSSQKKCSFCSEKRQFP